MNRRHFLRGVAALGLCPLCAASSRAADGIHWSYWGATGPDHWGTMGEANRACAAGAQQSPIDVTGSIPADIPAISVDWKKGAATLLNNGHTIQVNLAAGSRLRRGDKVYELLQFHFHAPSEHRLEGRSFPMEAHFVHGSPDGTGLGVLGVFFVPGGANPVFAGLAAAFPARAEGEATVEVDPTGLLPAGLGYYAYQGSLTTPPCSEVVDWMLAKEALPVAEADIARFTALFPMNARPILPANRRLILSSD